MNSTSSSWATTTVSADYFPPFASSDPWVYGVLALLTVAGSSAVFYLFAITSQLRSITGWLMVSITLTGKLLLLLSKV